VFPFILLRPCSQLACGACGAFIYQRIIKGGREDEKGICRHSVRSRIPFFTTPSSGTAAPFDNLNKSQQNDDLWHNTTTTNGKAVKKVASELPFCDRKVMEINEISRASASISFSHATVYRNDLRFLFFVRAFALLPPSSFLLLLPRASALGDKHKHNSSSSSNSRKKTG
jgi:hypothetical protein